MKISRIEWMPSTRGFERMKAFFRGHSFTPHKHDTYAIGMTLIGVQSFDYRGVARHSLPGQVFVLHPDERHDGRAGDERGFGYRIAYIDPAIIRDAAATKSLPFIRQPVSEDRRLHRAIVDVVAPQNEPTDELMSTCSLVALADALVCVAQDASAPTSPVEIKAVGLVREVLLDKLDKKISIGELETVSGLNRWQLARQFRTAFGVSPYRFHLLRRLNRARELLCHGCALAEVALSSGFADQAHFSRQFRSAYGLSPSQWRALAAGNA